MKIKRQSIKAKERERLTNQSSFGGNAFSSVNQASFVGNIFLSPPAGGIAGHQPGETNPLSGDIQGDFRSLKDSYQKVQLGAEIKLNAEKSSIRREDQPRYNVIVNSARYSETILKVLAERASAGGIGR